MFGIKKMIVVRDGVGDFKFLIHDVYGGSVVVMQIGNSYGD